ncbi:MAG: ferric reductase-like transmembrane domain-containing protein [Micrococcales bacterium]|nr:ferric reductase-like transmembrane domain-containing protein [Micrococcales bacterium]MCL2668758.1 ferric reductase-like transmembrane domain-containing protein [Micrococcales bacterium]
MHKGLAAIAGVFGLTVLFWALSSPADSVAMSGQVSQLLGGLALTGFAMLFAIATRAGVLDGLFDGLDKAYVVHKWLGVVSIGLVLVHFATHGGAGHDGTRGPGSRRSTGDGPLGGDGPLSDGQGPDRWGVGAMVAFVALVAVALAAKKLNHERWKLVHKLVAVAYGIGLVHYYGASQYGPWGTSPYSLWLNLVNLLGMAAAVYSVLLYEHLAFRHAYQVTGLRQVGENNLEVTASATGRALTWRPGQFTFVKFPRLAFPSHPFTIAMAPDGQNIQFAIRALGDHTTSLPDSLRVGDRLVTTAAHGRFDHTAGLPRQIWIAGGIGITPFRSFVQSGVPPQHSVDLFYSFNAGHGAYLDELATSTDNVRVHLVNTTETGLLTAQQIVQSVAPDGPVDVYFCGPQPMREALKHSLDASPLHVHRFHFEEFQFGR